EASGADELSPGRPFPLRRDDHTLFTLPLLASALFLLVKVNGLTLLSRAFLPGPQLKTAAALMLAGGAGTLMAVYLRESAKAPALTVLGWLVGGAGLVLAYAGSAAGPDWRHAAALAAAALAAVHLVYRFAVLPRHAWAEDVLVAPTRSGLSRVAALSSVAAIAALLLAAKPAEILPLLAVSAALAIWLGLESGSPVFGTLLFFESALAVSAAFPGTASVVAFLAVSALAYSLLEAGPDAAARLKPVVEPFSAWTAVSAGAAGLWAVTDGAFAGAASSVERLGLVAALLLAARSHACGPLALLGLIVAYVELSCGPLAATGLGIVFYVDPTRAPLAATGLGIRLPVLLSPPSLSLFALALAAQAESGRRALGSFPRLLHGPYGVAAFRSPALPWFHVAALSAASVAAARLLLDPALRLEPAAFAAPYLAAAAFAVVGLSWRNEGVYWSTAALTTFGNVLAVETFAGGALRSQGLATSHLVCLGAAATLAQARLLGLAARTEPARRVLDRLSLGSAAFMLALLMSTYFSRPDLEAMTTTRLLVSGLLALLAARRFQAAARAPSAAEADYAAIWEGAYHFGVTTSLWCAALLVPAARSPNAAFAALGVPVLYFYARAELGAAARYRNTATGLAWLLLVLYAFRGAFQAVLFPHAPLGLDHYHANGPFVMALALIQLRLHALGGTRWLGFYGGLSMIAGSYFTLTSLPGLSPFDPAQAAAAGWCAVGLGHFWLLVASQPSPVRSLLQRIGRLDDERWNASASAWGRVLLVGTQAAVLNGFAGSAPAAVLLGGGASVLAHHARLRGSVPLYGLALAEWLWALHAGALPSAAVVWAVLATWAALWLVSELRSEGLAARTIEPTSTILAAFAAWHVAAVHGISSDRGLAATVAAFGLLAATPRRSAEPGAVGETSAGWLLAAAPTWLAFASGLRFGLVWAALALAAAVLGTAFAARRASELAGEPAEPGRPRSLGHAGRLLAAHGAPLGLLLTFAATLLTVWIHAEAFDRAAGGWRLAALLGLYGGAAASWWLEARRRESAAAAFVAEGCVLGGLWALRGVALHTAGVWRPEHDVWASLAASFVLAGLRGRTEQAPRELRVPLAATLAAAPLAALGWISAQSLGADLALLVLGLNAATFAYLGRNDRESPYHVAAMTGLVSFVCLVFWSKLGLRTAQAYVIPVGTGILALVQLFRDQIAPDARNRIRATALLAMLGSAGYYALADDRYPLAFHTTMLVVSVASMTAGSLLQVRLYVLLGFAGLGTDLAALVYKVLLHMDRSARMTLIGGQVLVFGALLIGGAVVYKTHQAEIDAWIERARQRLAAWE
ncbi:MAG: hypothetical protein HY553_15590, partial [Elusimicrobia bacterium]|nr:hypothetical protein [Elusimicrobiota bacterium]